MTSRKGKNNPNWKGKKALYKQKYFCKCGKQISIRTGIYGSKKYKICAEKLRVGKHVSPHTEFKKGQKSPFKGRKHTLEAITQNRIKNKGKHHSLKTEFKKGYKSSKKLTSDTIVRHHIYLNKIGRLNTQIKLTKKYHDKIHNEAYDYIVRKGWIKEYIKQFYKKHNLGGIIYE